MSDFKTNTLDSSPLDPGKRVRYTTGLVMGVDEFQQDQFYLMERDHLHQRSLHGYGVVSGLGIETRVNAQSRWEVVVAPGLAVTPRGLSVCVDESQCANLDDWLDRHQDELTGSPPLIPGALPLWVVLCPRECETDPVPVLGDPCRTEEDATVPSRVADDFELKLSLEPPEQLEEEAVQRFGDLLRSFVIAESASPFLDQAAVEDLVRGLLPGSPSPPPPALPPEPLYLPADQAAELLAAAWRVWVTEVRPQLADGAEGCAGGGEPCIALGRLDVVVQDMDGNLEVASADPDVTERPFLLHTRVIQEWLTLALQPPRHGDLLGLDVDDHLQYLLVSPAKKPADRSLIANLNAAGNRVVGLPAAQAAGQAVPYEQAVKSGDPAGGDLFGTYRNPSVARIRNRDVAIADPNDGDVLTWSTAFNHWRPQAPTGGGGVPDLVEGDLTRIVALSWIHGQPSLPFLTLDSTEVFGYAVAFGKESPDSSVQVDPSTLHNRHLRIWLRETPGLEFTSDLHSPFLHHLEVPMDVVPAVLVGFDAQGLPHDFESSPDIPDAALMRVNPEVFNFIQEGSVLRIEILGDHILDQDGRAIDAEFVRTTLPTGARAAGAQFGIQGGHFESWLLVQTTRVQIARVNLNEASEEELTTLPSIGPSLAKRIVKERKAGGEFTKLEDLRRVSGISDNLIDRLRKMQDGES